MTAIRNMNKVTESIGDRVGGYNFLPALFTFGSRRKQCPLHSVNSESSLFDCTANDDRSLDWSLRIVQTQQYEPYDSTRVVEGQSDRRGRATRQSLFIARDRLRCEPGSNPVIITNTLTAIRNMNKVTESIGDRVGGYNFLPALFTFGSRRKQCPLHSVNSESSLFDCTANDDRSLDWSLSSPSGGRTAGRSPWRSSRLRRF